MRPLQEKLLRSQTQISYASFRFEPYQLFLTTGDFRESLKFTGYILIL